MEDFPTWLAVGLIVGLGPMFFRKKKKAKTQSVVVFCSYCGGEVGLEKVRNFICPHCEISFAYFKTTKNIDPIPTLQNYNCRKCGTLNFQNVKYCLNCGEEHGPTIRY